MRKNFTLLALLGLFASAALTAQTKFIDPIFAVGAPTEVTYATNISILTGAPAATDIKADVYLPEGDDSESLRPVVVTWHTGNFLPKIANFSAYGDKIDSINVNIMRQVVSRGYVGISADYRKGWLPTADDQDVRTGTLLKAVYRASQDAHAMARYLRKTVAEDGNPYRIDTSRIVFMGTGSGGYVCMAHAVLDRVEEIAKNAQFFDADGNLLVDVALDSNPFGTTTTPLNLENNSGYSSTVAMSINIAGALGDSTWMEGKDNEPMILAYHSLTDPFAPFHAGTVVVPVTNQPVVDVAGSNLFVHRANELGLNDKLASANGPTQDAMFGPLATAVNQLNTAFKGIMVQSPIPTATMDVFPYSRDNMFPLRAGAGSTGTTSGGYNFFDEPTLGALVAGWNSVFPDDPRDAAVITGGEIQTNSNYNMPAAAGLVLDTIMAHFLPRAFIGLELETLVSTEDVLTNNEIGLEVFPNPVSSSFTVKTEPGHTIRSINVIDINGRVVTTFEGVNQNTFVVNRGNLPRGTYILQLRLDDGMTARKLILE